MKKRRYKELRPIRLGCMQTEKTRHTEKSYIRALLSAGLIDENTTTDNSWSVWQSVCRDPEVIRLGMKLERQNNVSLPSVAAPFSNGTRVLVSMSANQIAALKERVGAA